jgi:hypothetical protein
LLVRPLFLREGDTLKCAHGAVRNWYGLGLRLTARGSRRHGRRGSSSRAQIMRISMKASAAFARPEEASTPRCARKVSANHQLAGPVSTLCWRFERLPTVTNQNAGILTPAAYAAAITRQPECLGGPRSPQSGVELSHRRRRHRGSFPGRLRLATTMGRAGTGSFVNPVPGVAFQNHRPLDQRCHSPLL